VINKVEPVSVNGVAVDLSRHRQQYCPLGCLQWHAEHV